MRVDGEIIEGHSNIDESMITGDPVPVEKKQGSQVTASTLNATWWGTNKVGAESLLAHIVSTVNEAGVFTRANSETCR